MRNFRNLRIYVLALALSQEIRVTTKAYPKEEKYGLVDQSCRAVDSIVLNIAEGAGCESERECRRYLGIAIGSAHELQACLDIAVACKYISNEEYRRLVDKVDKLIAMIYRFRLRLK